MRAPCYSEKLNEAAVLALDAFRYHRRKGGDIPYASHLFQVMVWVAESGGSEEQMIAALLHDYLEDVSGAQRAEIEKRFGKKVCGWVETLSDCTGVPKPPWRERKEAYVAKLKTQPGELKLIATADKLHNAMSTNRDLARVGEAHWENFNASYQETIWYYRAVIGALRCGWSHPLLDLLESEVNDLESRQ